MNNKKEELLFSFNEIVTSRGERAITEKESRDLISGNETDEEILEIASDYLNDLHSERCEARREREMEDNEIASYEREMYG